MFLLEVRIERSNGASKYCTPPVGPLLDVGVERGGLYLTVAFDLDEDAVVAGMREAVGETHFRRQWTRRQPQMNVVLNWFRELQERVPVK